MKAIEQPTYNNSDLSSRDAWFMNNLRAVMNYMDKLGVTDYDEIMDLVAIQYDRQVMLDRLDFELQLTYQLAQVTS
jgi:hypothetical protein